MSYDPAKITSKNVDDIADTNEVDLVRACYAEDLRAIGQSLEAQTFTTVKVKLEPDGYRVYAEVDKNEGKGLFAAMLKSLLPTLGLSAQEKKKSSPRLIERRYPRKEIETLMQEGITKRLDIHAVPDHFGLSNILRQAGAYLDDLHHATLSEVIVEGLWITIRYEDSQGQRKELKQDLQFFYDYWVKMYLRRSARSGPTLASARPTYLTAFETDPRFKG
jgi:hypothetical protein